MTSLKNTYQTSEKLEAEKGIWLEFPECDCSFQILRAGGKNKRYTKAAEKYGKKFKRAIEQGKLSRDKDREIMLNIYSESVIIGWKGVKDDNGKDLPFTPENCKKIFKEVDDLFKIIAEEASNFVNFQEEIEEVKKK